MMDPYDLSSIESIDPELAMRISAVRRVSAFGSHADGGEQARRELDEAVSQTLYCQSPFPHWAALLWSSAHGAACFVGCIRYYLLVCGQDPTEAARRALLRLRSDDEKFDARLTDIGRSGNAYDVWAVAAIRGILSGQYSAVSDFGEPPVPGTSREPGSPGAQQMRDPL